eukprot:3030329-Pyramimonas_sp.AAC.1
MATVADTPPIDAEIITTYIFPVREIASSGVGHTQSQPFFVFFGMFILLPPIPRAENPALPQKLSSGTAWKRYLTPCVFKCRLEHAYIYGPDAAHLHPFSHQSRRAGIGGHCAFIWFAAEPEHFPK